MKGKNKYKRNGRFSTRATADIQNVRPTRAPQDRNIPFVVEVSVSPSFAFLPFRII